MFDLNLQKKRSIMNKKIRDFFDSKDYIEVFTPTLSDTLIPEVNIQNFQTKYVNEFLKDKDFFLIPSPEIFMKKILAETKENIYQISSCFRNCEQIGHLHNPEFSMLEYYSIDFDEIDSIKLTEELLNHLKDEDTPKYALPPFDIISVKDAFDTFLNLDLDAYQNDADFREKLRSLGHNPTEDEVWQDMFNRLFLQYVEPFLCKDKPLILKDYPKQIDCLAQVNGNYRRRWEMYINNVEIANCYKEESSKAASLIYYQEEIERIRETRKGTNLPCPNIDLNFSSLDIPSSSGVAIGLDRLLMSLLGKKDLSNLILFPLQEMLNN